MTLKEYDKIRLKTGERGCILEIFGDGVFLAEIISKNGDIRTIEIESEEIKSRIVEVEEAFS